MAPCSIRVGSVSFVSMAIMCSLTLFQTLQKSFTLNFRRKGREVSAGDLSAIVTHLMHL